MNPPQQGGPPAPGSAPPPGSRPPGSILSRFRTEGYAGYSCAYSPFFPNSLAVASAANFGLVGNGRLWVVDVVQGAAQKRYDTQDGLYDVAWSEVHENQLATASGDGSIKLWDLALNDLPIRNWHEHQREVFCLDWGNIRKELFASSSWDHTIKIWTPERPTSLQTIPAHTACVYAALFSPHQADSLASCSSDGLLKIWDLKQQASTGASPASPGMTGRDGRAALTIAAHPTEVLSLDWNKYVPHLIATASVDRTVRVHDLRMASSSSSAVTGGATGGSSCIATMAGHDFAIRRVAWSPHHSNVLASSGYDMTCRIWKTGEGAPAPPIPRPMGIESQGTSGARCTDMYGEHREFVIGMNWSLYEPGVLATCSWDQEVHVWRPNLM